MVLDCQSEKSEVAVTPYCQCAIKVMRMKACDLNLDPPLLPFNSPNSNPGQLLVNKHSRTEPDLAFAIANG